MKTYVLAGASSRGFHMYASAIVKRYGDCAKLGAIFDKNSMRAKFVRDSLDPSIPVYTDFDAMLRQVRPDTVIVTTMDSVHHEYIVRALDFGCDVISEKPMTIDAQKCREIFEAEKRSGKKIIVTFNCRFMPYVKKVKELLDGGAVGKILSVDFQWLLDRHHGADYFRRWHKVMANSGGLLLTKATHHFDMANWWIGQAPEKVYANGQLDFYGPNGSGGKSFHDRCRGCPKFKTCELAFEGFDDLAGEQANAFLNGMYFIPEKEDGYRRDQCVFAQSDIYDNMSLSVRYRGGVLMTYSLHAFAPYEGWRVAFNGTRGRLEAYQNHRGFGSDDPMNHIAIFTPDGARQVLDFPKATGMHGGADDILIEWLLREKPADPLNQLSGSYDGAMSLLIGAAANLSIAQDKPIYINDLVNCDDYR